MRLPVIAVVAANFIVLLVTNAVFRDWVVMRFGYVDPDMVGLSGLAWPMLAMLGIVAVAIGFWVRAARWAAVGLIGLLGLVILDHAFGAMRDGHVSDLGVSIGLLMVLQCGTLLGGLVLATGPGAGGRRAVVGMLLAVVAAGLAVMLVAIGRGSDAGLREAAVRDWLAELAVPPDHGIDRLAGGVNEAAYLRDAGATAWTDVAWDVQPATNNDGFWSVEVALADGSPGILDFFFDHGLARPMCDGDEVVGIGVQVVVPAFGPAAVDGGPMTGTQAAGRCTDLAPEHSPPPSLVRWGDRPTWSGASLEVLNRTRLDVFLIDEGGARVDVPACGRVATDRLSLAAMVQVRAEGGYIFAFGTGELERTTTYVVIVAGEPEMNNAPPLPPLPPCEGEPQVQPGV